MKLLNYDDFVMNESNENKLATVDEIENTEEYKDILKSFPVESELSINPDKFMCMDFNIKSLHVFDINCENLHSKNNYYASLSIRRTSDLISKLVFYRFYYIYTPISIDSPQVEKRINSEIILTTLDECKKTLIKIKEILKDIFNELKQKGVIVNFERPVDYRDISVQMQEKIINKVIDGDFKWNRVKTYISPNINSPKLHKYLIDKAINKKIEWDDIKDHIPSELWKRYKGARIMSQYGM